MIRCVRVSTIEAFLLTFIACGMLAALPAAAIAQSVSGTILGTVTDVSGAVMARRQSHSHQRGHGADPYRHLRRQRRIHASRRFRPGATP